MFVPCTTDILRHARVAMGCLLDTRVEGVPISRKHSFVGRSLVACRSETVSSAIETGASRLDSETWVHLLVPLTFCPRQATSAGSEGVRDSPQGILALLQWLSHEGRHYYPALLTPSLGLRKDSGKS